MKAMGRFVALLLGAALIGACGSGGSGSPGGGEPGPVDTEAQETLTVQMDQNGDGEPDLLTLDISESPFKILEALEGVAGGGHRDVTDLMRGLEIDPEIAKALADHVANTFNVRQRSELDVVDALDRSVTVVVFE